MTNRAWRPRRFMTNLCLLVLVICICWSCAAALPAAVDAELDRVAPPPPVVVDKQDVPGEPAPEPEPPTTTFEATAYSWECGTGDGLTATGTRVRPGVVAVDPAVIPYGSTVEIVGVGEFTAEDTGGAIRGNRVDVFMSSREAAIQFGRQTVEVRVVE